MYGGKKSSFLAVVLLHETLPLRARNLFAGPKTRTKGGGEGEVEGVAG